MTPQKNNIVDVKPDELKAGDIVHRYQTIGEPINGIDYKPVAKFLIIGRVSWTKHPSEVYFDAYLLWCDENYLGNHNKVGDMWQIPWYAFKNGSEYKVEFKCDISDGTAKHPSILTNQREKQNEV